MLQVGSALFVCDVEEAEEGDDPPPPTDFAARDAPMRALWRRMVRLADSDASVLILGELGGGKTRIAHLLHQLGPRRGRPFVAHNASALPRNLEEATLFGVVAGFIPTVKAQDGLISRAGDGTLFLDELAELPEPAQAKLLDAFDPREPSYLAVGGSRRLPTRCRLITATNRDVFVLARTGALRHDLLSRLAVGQLTVPPLRERRSDILPLFNAALARAGAADRGVTRMEEALALLLARWTENVRGLETLAQRAALGEPLTVELIRSHADRGAGEAAPAPPPASVVAVPAAPPASPAAAPWPPNRAELVGLLAEHGWEIKAAAEAIGRRRETLSRLVTTLFGSREAAQEAWRAWQRTGIPPSDP
ncbi:MAG: sigma 54-interacting transcriptional regulator [bacterium]